MKLRIATMMILVSLVSIAAYSTNAGAADGITPYFSVRLWTGFSKADKDFTGSSADGYTNKAAGKDDMDLVFNEPFTGGVNMGLKGEMNNVKGVVEIGVPATGVSLRHLYATYNLGPAELLFGRTWTPYTNKSGNNIADDDNFDYAASSYDERAPQVRLTFAGIFYIDLVQPKIAATSINSALTSAYIDATLPKLAAGINLPAGPAKIGAHFVYEEYKIAKETSTNATVIGLDGTKVKGWILPLSAKVKMDPIEVGVATYYGKNIGVLGIRSFSDVQPNIDASGTSLKDNTAQGGKLDLSFNAGVGKLNAGFAYEKTKDDVSGAKDDESMSYYVNFMYNLEKNMYIAPAWWRVDKKKDGNSSQAKQGVMDKFGLKFQANF